MRDNTIERLRQINNKYGIEALLMEFDCNDYGDFTLEEIGKVLGITRERVRQIEATAIKKLKHPKVGRQLKQYYRDGADTIDLAVQDFGR